MIIDPRRLRVLTLWLDERDDDANENQQLVVRLSNQNQQEYPAEVPDNDQRWGLAVLKIDVDRPLPAISLKNLREPESNGAVLLVPSVPRKKPVKGWITFPEVALGQKSPYSYPYSYIESNIRLPDGEAGSLLVTSGGDPIGMMVNQVGANQDGSFPSHAIPLNAVLAFIDSDPALQEMLGHLAPNPRPASRSPYDSDADPMESPRLDQPREPGEWGIAGRRYTFDPAAKGKLVR